ncbi:type II secretion system protein M [Desulfofundulus sp. TPOSR]|uniref:type 4a pilus biogenesis protein PilO n=1 Tax=Desulfofundulus sp. TPOSR TaxID=2714340 RepID=UPI0014084D29|nr:type 4a pilus biogenesis protein PilO [Desulfofundulus sp. TPOSR]NHM28142.1 type II secretion system protein M [Desulfofundulus sp. TPOSR]
MLKNVKERLAAWWSARQDREKKLMVALATVLVVALSAALLWHGVKTASEARKDLSNARDNLRAARAEAASLPAEKERLEEVRFRWETAKTKLWRDAETGITLKDVEDAARSPGAQLLYFEPEKRVEAFYRNHLRALPVKVKLSGTFPAVLAAVEKIERLANPGEVRAVKIEAAEKEEVPGSVEADITLVLYSLNPPETRERVPGESGKYDPFFPLVVPEEQVPEQPGGTAQPEGPIPQENLPVVK